MSQFTPTLAVSSLYIFSNSENSEEFISDNRTQSFLKAGTFQKGRNILCRKLP